MIIHDISRDALTAPVYAGDPETVFERVKSIEAGEGYNLSCLSMTVHCGTHIDAPLHFYEDGSPIDKMRLSTFCGKCTVIGVEGVLTGEDMEKLLGKKVFLTLWVKIREDWRDDGYSIRDFGYE